MLYILLQCLTWDDSHEGFTLARMSEAADMYRRKFTFSSTIPQDYIIYVAM